MSKMSAGSHVICPSEEDREPVGCLTSCIVMMFSPFFGLGRGEIVVQNIEDSDEGLFLKCIVIRE